MKKDFLLRIGKIAITVMALLSVLVMVLLMIKILTDK